MSTERENTKKNKKLPAFYIALCGCVLMIGVAGYFTQKQTEEVPAVSENDTTIPVFSNDGETLTVPSPTPAAKAASAPTAAPTEAPASEPAAAPEFTPVPTDAPPEPTEEAVMEYAVDNPDLDGGAVTVANELPAFIKPVNGDIIEPFTETLAYNASLDDWRTHNGVDIAADSGCSVQAAAQGEVERVYEDAMGVCVELSHAGGFVTRYMGLSGAENLSEGKEVKSGEVIGTTGQCRGENTSAPHLHFEMEKDGKAVNPKDYLPN